jgi:hypothetical protein
LVGRARIELATNGLKVFVYHFANLQAFRRLTVLQYFSSRLLLPIFPKKPTF